MPSALFVILVSTETWKNPSFEKMDTLVSFLENNLDDSRNLDYLDLEHLEKFHLTFDQQNL